MSERLLTEHDVLRARNLALQAHAGQVDKTGQPYIDHPREVAHKLRTGTALVQVVAWLHDIVEDTDVQLGQIEQKFGAEAAAAVDAITHRKGEANTDYYHRVLANPVALAVKGADLAHNTEPMRTRLLEPVLRARLAAKYAIAYRALGLTPPGPLVEAERIPVTVGDIATQGPNQVIIAWFGPEQTDARAVFIECSDGQFRGTAAADDMLRYEGVYDNDMCHLYSIPDDWTVTDPQWDL